MHSSIAFAFVIALGSPVEDDKARQLDEALYRGKVDVATKLVEENPKLAVSVDRNGTRPLMIAAQSGRKALVDLLLKHGADIEARDDDGQSVIHNALSYETELEQREIILTLLDRKPNVKTVDESGRTPLHAAVFSWDVEIVDRVLQLGADINPKTERSILGSVVGGINPHESEVIRFLVKKGADVQSCKYGLMSYMGDKSIDNAKTLLDCGFDVDTRHPHGGGETALHFLAFAWRRESPEDTANAIKMARLFLSRGASVDARDANGDTPLHIAAREDFPELVELLLSSGAAINAQNKERKTPYALAIEYGSDAAESLESKGGKNLANFEDSDLVDYLGAVWEADLPAVRKLLDEHSDLAHCNSERNSPLHRAVWQRNLPLVKLLVDRGADLQARRTTELYNWFLPLHDAAREDERVPMLEYLISKGADVDCRTQQGQTPLFFAVDVKLAAALLKHGADLKATTPEGRTLLHTVKDVKLTPAVYAWAIEKGLDPDTPDRKGQTPLHTLCNREKALSKKTQLEYAEILLGAGANANAKDKAGRTPLYYAALHGRHHLCALLIEKGADANAQDHRGWTALMPAARMNKAKTIRILIENGADKTIKDRTGRTASDLDGYNHELLR